MSNEALLSSVIEKARKWLDPKYDAQTRAEVQAMLDADDKTPLIEAFYSAPEACAALWVPALTV